MDLPELTESLVALIGWIPGEDPIPTLLVEMKDGPFLQARVSAASALSDRRREEAVTAMIAPAHREGTRRIAVAKSKKTEARIW